MLQKNQKQTEQQTRKTLQVLDGQQQQQQQQQKYIKKTTNQTHHKMPPLEYSTLSPTRIQHLKEEQGISTKTTFSHLPHCKLHGTYQQHQPTQLKHHKTCRHHLPFQEQQQQEQQQHHHQHHQTSQHISPFHKNSHHHHHHHLHLEQKAQKQQECVYVPHHHHTLNLQQHKHEIKDQTMQTKHYKSSPEISRSTISLEKTQTAKNLLKTKTLSSNISPMKKEGIRRCRSHYNSFEDFDAKTRTEKKVVASLKYLCACTGATIRNLSKKTKNFHATQQFAFTYTKKVNSAKKKTNIGFENLQRKNKAYFFYRFSF